MAFVRRSKKAHIVGLHAFVAIIGHRLGLREVVTQPGTLIITFDAQNPSVL